jgi:hypothetical protein
MEKKTIGEMSMAELPALVRRLVEEALEKEQQEILGRPPSIADLPQSSLRSYEDKPAVGLDINDLLAQLSKLRPIFHSEADFQHALAWLLHEKFPDASIRLELPFVLAEKAIHVDIWMTLADIHYAIELKYKPHALSEVFSLNGEKYALRTHSAQDLGRYDFIKDICRIEQIQAARKDVIGYAILLTNESLYWSGRNGRLRETVDLQFRLDEGRELSGSLAWSSAASVGTIRGRENPLTVNGTYPLRWQDYSSIATPRHGKFRYLSVEMKPD